MNYKSFILLMIFAVIICISSMGSVSAADPPSANFTSNITNGSAPLSVQFNDTSTGSPTSWLWNFGDGNTSAKQNPVHNYTKNGNYSVSLTVTNVAGSGSLTQINYITVLPTANTSLPSGIYKTTQTVKLTSNDPKATIYYTNDATDPQTSSTKIKYTGPISISKTTTLRYRAVDANGNWSTLYLQNYVIGTGSNGIGGLANTTWAKSGGDLSNTGRSNYTGPKVNTTLWNYTTGGSVSGFGSPVIGSDGTIYVGSSDCKLYALNVDGSIKWTYTTGGSVNGLSIGADGTIYVGSFDGSLYALNQDGTLKWKYKTPGNIFCAPAISTDGTIYFGTCDGNLYALNHDGTLKWNYTTIGLIYGLDGGPAIGSDGTIYMICGGDYGTLYAFKPDGTVKWSYRLGDNLESSPLIGADGTIYAGGTNGVFYAFNPDGTLKWNYSNGGSSYSYDTMIIGSAIGADGTIYFGCSNGYLYALNVDGTLKWNYSTGGRIQGSPTIGADGTIYFGSNDGKLYALNPDGTLLWSYTTGGAIDGSVAIGANETLYFGSGDNNIYAIANTVCRANQTAGAAPLTVQFNGSGISPVSWYWNFGDGKTSTEQNPVHTYVNAGYYNVTLTVTSSNGQKRTVRFTRYIKVYNSPVSSFTASTSWGTVPSAVPAVYNQIQFKDTSANIPTSWYWDFGDGATSTEQNPTHAYTKTGTYTIKLTVTNPAGNNTFSYPIQVLGTISANSTLANGTYNTTQTAKLTSKDSTATIYYTNDTTDPRTSSTRIKYTKPISISKTTTLRYAAVTTIGKWSPLYVQNYVIGTGGLVNSPSPTYEGNNNNTGQSEYTGPQTNTTKWNDSNVNPIMDTGVSIGSDGTIYSGSSNGYLYALYPTGVIKWVYYTGSSSYVTTPTIGKNGTIYIAASGYLDALNPDGTLIWNYSIGDTNCEVSPLVGADGTIYIGSYDISGFLDTALYAINPNGTLKWNTDIGFENFLGGAMALGSDGTIYVPTSNSLYAINPDGTIKWSYAFGNHQSSSPSIDPDGTIYIVASTGWNWNDPSFLYAINPDGTLKWNYTVKSGQSGTASIGSDGTIYLLNGGSLFAINPNNGTQEWNCTVTGSSSSLVIGADGTIYCGLSAISPSGQLKWTYTGILVSSNPVIDSDGTLYIGTNNGLYAFRDTAAKFNYTIGPNPLYMQFNDTSTNPTSWKWNFSDGTTSTLQNPNHTYITSGQYLVTLTATLTSGETLTAAQMVTISDITPPTVTISPNGCNFNTTQTITLNATDDSGNMTVYYTTDGSDPQTSSTRGIYTTPLTVTGTTTLNYAAVDSSGNWSPVYEETYTKSGPVPGVTIYVQNASNYTTGSLNDQIQTILDKAASGSTIEFLGSNYDNLHLTINKQLNIISNVGTKITASNSFAVFLINGTQAAGTTIKGFIITNTGTGILLNNTSNVTISNDIISSTSGTAILINGSSNTTIRSSTIHDSVTGIDVSGSTGTQINKSNINNNGNGIDIENSKNISANNNQITGNTKNGIYVNNSNNTTINGNTIKKNGNAATNGSGICLENSTNININSNQINENFYGITCDNITNATIKNNTFLNNDRDGILLSTGVKNITIASNTMQNNDNGINVNCASENLTIRANLITGSTKKASGPRPQHGNGVLFGTKYVYSSTFLLEHNILRSNAYMDFQSCNAAGNYVAGSNWYGSYCKKVFYDPQMTMEIVRTGNNEFSVLFRDGITNEVVTDLPSFTVTFMNGPYSETVTSVNGIATAALKNLANGDVVGIAYGVTTSTAYNSPVTKLSKSDSDNSNQGNNNNGSSTAGDGPGSGSGNGQGGTGSSDASGSSSSSGASSGSASSTGLMAAAAAAGSSGQAGSNGQQSQQSKDTKKAQELFIDNPAKSPQFWGIIGIIVLLVAVFGVYYRKNLMSMIKKSKK